MTVSLFIDNGESTSQLDDDEWFCYRDMLPILDVSGKHNIADEKAESFFVTLKDTKTGEIKKIPENTEWSASLLYLWDEGNFACDCNRSSYFIDDDDDIPCRGDRFYLLNFEINGHVYEWEEETSQPHASA